MIVEIDESQPWQRLQPWKKIENDWADHRYLPKIEPCSHLQKQIENLVSQ